MSKLLQTLDQAVLADLDSVAESVLDKNYMGQLVAVQHKRGASGGLVFSKALGLSLDLGLFITYYLKKKYIYIYTYIYLVF